MLLNRRGIIFLNLVVLFGIGNYYCGLFNDDFMVMLFNISNDRHEIVIFFDVTSKVFSH